MFDDVKLILFFPTSILLTVFPFSTYAKCYRITIKEFFSFESFAHTTQHSKKSLGLFLTFTKHYIFTHTVYKPYEEKRIKPLFLLISYCASLAFLLLCIL